MGTGAQAAGAMASAAIANDALRFAIDLKRTNGALVALAGLRHAGLGSGRGSA
jgi:hypothetical protein